MSLENRIKALESRIMPPSVDLDGYWKALVEMEATLPFVCGEGAETFGEKEKNFIQRSGWDKEEFIAETRRAVRLNNLRR